MKTDFEKMPQKRLDTLGTVKRPSFASNEFCNGKESFCNAVGKRNPIAISNSDETGTPTCDIFDNVCDVVICNEEDAWTLVAPFGEWIKWVFTDSGAVAYKQEFDGECASQIVAKFRSLLSRVKTAFWNTCPVYFGHPDDDRLSAKYPDCTPYGKVLDLEIRADGLYAKIKWLEGFEALPKRLRFSPRWDTEVVGNVGDGTKLVRPFALRSVGLVENPNIKTAVFANEQAASDSKILTQTKGNEMIKQILEFLKFAAADVEKLSAQENQSEAVAAVQKKTEELYKTISALESAKQVVEGELAKIRLARTEAEEKLATATTALANSQESLKAERLARATLVVANCVAAGKIIKADADARIATLANAEDFDAVAAEFENRAPVVNTTSKTDGIEGKNKKTLSNEAEQNFFVEVGKYQKKGIAYEDAWRMARAQQPELYKAAYGAER